MLSPRNRDVGIRKREDSSPHSPAKKRRKLSLSLKKVKKIDGIKPVDLEPESAIQESALPELESKLLVGDKNSDVSLPKLIPSSESIDEPGVESRTSNAEPVSSPGPHSSQDRANTTHSPEGYYLFIFKFILDTVLTNIPERHIITQDAQEVVKTFRQLPQKEQQLYVRLFLRKHQWHRVGKISYKDIAADLGPVIQVLVQNGLLIDESHLSEPAELLSLLQLSELKDLRKQLNLPSSAGGQKALIIEAMFKHAREHRPLFGKSLFMSSLIKRAKKLLGWCVKVSSESFEVFSKIMLLFSLTNDLWTEEDNDFSQIIFRLLQVNIGALKYPEYEIEVTQSLFPTEDSFQKYYEATKDEQTLTQAINDKDDTLVNSSLEKVRAEFISELKSHDIKGNRSPESHDIKRYQPTEPHGIKRHKPSASESQDIKGHKPSESDDTLTTLPPFLLPYTALWRYARLLSTITEYLEKRGLYTRANEVLECLLAQREVCVGSRGRWWERLALNYDYHLKEKEKCLEVIHSALDDPHVRPPRRLSLIKRARKLCVSLNSKSVKKATSKTKSKRAKSKKFGMRFELTDFPEMELQTVAEVTISATILRTSIKPVYLASSTSTPQTTHTPSTPHTSHTPSHPCTAMVGVEGYAMYHYNTSEGWPCAVHGEGSTFSTLFGLLMWEVLFAGGITNVFRTPYQSAPLDLRTDYFYRNRREIIEHRLAWIRTSSCEDLGLEVERCWRQHSGVTCMAINWELFTAPEDAGSLAVCMGGELLARVCELFSVDYVHSCGGLPDLILWNPVESTCKFVEVKGPGDRLSTKQMVWLSRLVDWGCSVEVCHVRGSSTRSLD